jgi:DNA-binding NarL/FixJ family response regulator
MSNIKVLIADDHELFRQSLQSLLNRSKSIDVVHTVSDGEELLDFLEESSDKPDVILLDIRMKPMNGFECLQEITTQYHDINVIMVSMFDNPNNVIEALRLGASSYLTKNSSSGQMIEAIRCVYEKGEFTTEIMSKVLINSIKNKSQPNPKSRYKGKELNEGEKDIIRLICQEKTNDEIAITLMKSKRTIETTRMRIMDKIGCKNMIGIVKYALKEGIYKEIES